jgi:exodeoxyribonuclease VII large subunit
MTDPVDLILLARGGGSEQSLAVFNDYRICREICLSTIPIVAAIGHEKDLSAAELCAHLLPTPSTPSGAGRFLAQRWQGLIDDLRSLMNNWLGMAFDRLSDEQDRLAALVAHLPQSLRRRRRYEQRHLADQVRLFRRQGLTMLAARQSGVRREADSCRKGALHRMAQAAVRVKKTAAGCDFRLLDQRLMAQKERVQQIAARLAFSGRRFLGLQQERLTIQSSVVGAHSPASVLRRGFTLLFDPQGKVIPTQKAFREGMKGRLHFHDGDIDVTAGESGEQK